MPFTRPGRDAALTINPATGKFDLSWGPDGNPIFDSTEVHRVASLLLEHRAAWIVDTAGNRGSLLHTLRELRRRTPSQAEAMALEALAKAVNDGAIDNVDARARKVTTYGRLTLDIKWRVVKTGVQSSLTTTIRT